MYTVTLQNFEHAPHNNRHASYSEARKQAIMLGFESCVWWTGPDSESVLVASYGPLYGLRIHNRELAGFGPAPLPVSITVSGIGEVTDPELIKKHMGK